VTPLAICNSSEVGHPIALLTPKSGVKTFVRCQLIDTHGTAVCDPAAVEKKSGYHQFSFEPISRIGIFKLIIQFQQVFRFDESPFRPKKYQGNN
jgi:hypothetical protein